MTPKELIDRYRQNNIMVIQIKKGEPVIGRCSKCKVTFKDLPLTKNPKCPFCQIMDDFKAGVKVGVYEVTEDAKLIPGDTGMLDVVKISVKCRNCGKTENYTIDRDSDGKYDTLNKIKQFSCLGCGIAPSQIEELLIKKLKASKLTNIKQGINDYINTGKILVLNRDFSDYGTVKSINYNIIANNKNKYINTNMFVPKEGFKLTPNIVGKTYGTMTVQGVEVNALDHNNVPDNGRYICECSACKQTVRMTYSELKRNKKCELCAFGDKLKANVDKVDLNSYVGRIVNNCLVKDLSDDGIFTMSCLTHNSKDKNFTVRAYNMVNYRNSVICPACNTSDKEMRRYWRCTNCGAENLSVGDAYDIYGAGKFRCKKCKAEIDKSIVNLQADRDAEELNALNKYINKNKGFRGIDADSHVAKFCMAYIGTDGKPRYNCYCLRHKQELLLTEDEYNDYANKHKYCEKEYSKFISMVNTKRDASNDSVGKNIYDKAKKGMRTKTQKMKAPSEV